MNTRLILPACFALLLVHVGCDAPGAADPPVSAQPATLAPESDEAIMNRLMMPMPEAVRSIKSDHEIVQDDLAYGAGTLGSLVPQLSGRSVEEADALIAQAIDEADPDHQWAVEVIAAQYFLDALHVREQAKDHPALVEKYTSMLLDHESQRTDLMVPSLDVLAGKWSFEQRQNAAAQSVAAAETWLAEVDAFLGQGTARIKEPHDDGLDENIAHVSNGIDDLRSAYNLE